MKKTYCLLIILSAVFIITHSANASYDKPYIGEEGIYIAKEEDTLVKIARAFTLGYVEMRAANQYVDPWLPGEGNELVLPSWHLLPDAPKEGIVINLPEMRLYAFINGNKEPYTFPLGIGREGLETPVGTTKVVRKKDGPSWRPTKRMRREDPNLPEVVLPGPNNPLGTHALYLGWPTYAIHGTDKPYGIGRRISSGCIRLYPENIKELFKLIPVDTKVTVLDQPVKLAWIDDVLYMEAHPNMDQAIQMEETGQVYSTKVRNDDLQDIVKFAGEFKNRLHWATIRTAIRERSGRPVMIARKPNAVVKKKKVKVIKVLPEIAEPIDDKKSSENTSVIKPEQKPEIASIDKVSNSTHIDTNESQDESADVLKEIYDNTLSENQIAERQLKQKINN